MGKKIEIEVGTDEGIVGSSSVIETEMMLLEILAFCKSEKLPPPSFMVVQTGTKVMEMKNTGILNDKIHAQSDMTQHQDLIKLIDMCKRHNVLLKEHNADYLSDEALVWHPKIGIDSANIAPEFGVIETKAFLSFLKENQLWNLYDRTIELAYNSGKWKKWMLNDTVATDYDRAVIAGHYVFSTEAFAETKKEAALRGNQIGVDLDSLLKNAVKNSLYRCLSSFGLMRHDFSDKMHKTMSFTHPKFITA